MEEGIKLYEVELNLNEQEKIREDLIKVFSADKIEIENNVNYEMTAKLLKMTKGKTKEVKEFYEYPKNVAHSIHKEICLMEKEDLSKLDNFEKVAKKAMSSYLLRIETSKENTDSDKNEIITEIPKVEGVSVSDKYTYEIEDESLLPKEYLMPNEKKIADMIKASNGTIEIPGVKIIKDKVISVRA